jgi:predicted DNA-binding protein YlxM (UPF0122 family)
MTTSTFALDCAATQFLVEHDGQRWATQHERVQYRSGAADIIFIAEDENYTCEQDVDAQEIERSELAQKILDSLCSLSRKQRIVWSYVFDGYNQAEIARKTGVNVQAVSKIIANTRNHVEFHAKIIIQRERLSAGEKLPMRDSSSDFCPPPIPDGFVGQLSLFGGDL